jgi:hypothetical protein
MNWFKNHKKLTLALIAGGLLVVILAVGASNSSKKEDGQKQATANRCLAVPEELVASMASGLTVNDGGSLRNAQAVKSNDFENVYFVSADLQGAGLEGDDDIATFATNSLSAGGGIIMAINGSAKEFSKFPDGSTTSFKVTVSNDGAQASQDCVTR